MVVVGFLLVVVGSVVGQLAILISACRHPSLAYDGTGWSKAHTVWLLLLTGWIGGFYYLARIRPKLAPIVRPTREPRQPDNGYLFQ